MKKHSLNISIQGRRRVLTLIGVDQDSGLVHSVEVTGTNAHAVARVPKLFICQSKS